MTEKEVRETLTEYRSMKRGMIEAIQTISILSEKSTATGSMAPKEVQVISSLPLAARFEDVVLDKVNLESILATELDLLEQMKTEALDLILLLGNRKHKIIMLEYYIECKTNSEIARQLHYDLNSIKRIKRKAIKAIAEKSGHCSVTPNV